MRLLPASCWTERHLLEFSFGKLKAKASISWVDVNLPLILHGVYRSCDGFRGRLGHDSVLPGHQRELTRFAWSKRKQWWNPSDSRLYVQIHIDGPFSTVDQHPRRSGRAHDRWRTLPGNRRRWRRTEAPPLHRLYCLLMLNTGF